MDARLEVTGNEATAMLFALIIEAKHKSRTELTSYKQRILQFIKEERVDVNAVVGNGHRSYTTALESIGNNIELFSFLHFECGAIRCLNPTLLSQPVLSLVSELDLSHSPYVIGTDLDVIKQYCSNVKKLHLSNCQHITYNTFQRFNHPNAPDIILCVSDLEKYGYTHTITSDDISEVNRYKPVNFEFKATSTLSQMSLKAFTLNKSKIIISDININSNSLLNSQLIMTEKDQLLENRREILGLLLQEYYAGQVIQDSSIPKLENLRSNLRLFLEGSDESEESKHELEKNQRRAEFLHRDYTEKKKAQDYKFARELQLIVFEIDDSDTESDNEVATPKEITTFLKSNLQVQHAIIDGANINHDIFNIDAAILELFTSLKTYESIRQITIKNTALSDNLIESLRELVFSNISIQYLKIYVEADEVQSQIFNMLIALRARNSLVVTVFICKAFDTDRDREMYCDVFRKNIDSTEDCNSLILVNIQGFTLEFKAGKDDSSIPRLISKYGIDVALLNTLTVTTIDEGFDESLKLEQHKFAKKVDMLITRGLFSAKDYQREFFRDLNTGLGFLLLFSQTNEAVLKSINDEFGEVEKQYRARKLISSQCDDKTNKKILRAIEPSYLEVLERKQRFLLCQDNDKIGIFYLHIKAGLMFLLQACGLEINSGDSINEEDANLSDFECLTYKEILINFIKGNDKTIKTSFVLGSIFCRRAIKLFELVARGIATDDSVLKELQTLNKKDIPEYVFNIAKEVINIIVTRKATPYPTVEQTAQTLVAVKLLGIEDALSELKQHSETNDIQSTMKFLVEKIQLLEKKADVIVNNTVEINKTTKDSSRQIKQTLDNSVESLRIEHQVLETTLKIQSDVESIKGTLEQTSKSLDVLRQGVMAEFVKIHGENADVRAVLRQHEANFSEYRQQFDEFSSEQLKLTRELKDSFDKIVTTLADAEQQATYFFQGKSKVAIFCREMYSFGSKKLDLYARIAKGEAPPEDSLDSAIGLVSNNADLIPVPGVPFVVKGFCQIAKAIYHGVKGTRAKKIDHFPIDEVLLDLVKGVAMSYIEIIEALEDYESLKAMGETAFRLIIKFMMNKEVLEKLNPKDPNMPVDSDVLLNILLSGLLNNSRLHLAGGTKITFIQHVTTVGEKMEVITVSQLSTAIDKIPTLAVCDKISGLVQINGQSLNTAGLEQIVDKIKQTLSIGVNTYALRLPTAEEAFQYPRLIVVMDGEQCVNSFVKTHADSERFNKNKYLYAPCFISKRVWNNLPIELGLQPQSDAKPLSEINHHHALVKVVQAEVFGPENQDMPKLKPEQKCIFLELVIRSECMELSEKRVIARYNQVDYQWAASTMRSLSPTVKVIDSNAVRFELNIEINENNLFELLSLVHHRNLTIPRNVPTNDIRPNDQKEKQEATDKSSKSTASAVAPQSQEARDQVSSKALVNRTKLQKVSGATYVHKLSHMDLSLACQLLGGTLLLDRIEFDQYETMITCHKKLQHFRDGRSIHDLGKITSENSGQSVYSLLISPEEYKELHMLRELKVQQEESLKY